MERTGEVIKSAKLEEDGTVKVSKLDKKGNLRVKNDRVKVKGGYKLIDGLK
jgi:hypothetical protein